MKRMIRSSKGGDGNQLSTRFLEVMEMPMAAYVIIAIKKDKPTKGGESVLMRGNGSSAGQ